MNSQEQLISDSGESYSPSRESSNIQTLDLNLSRQGSTPIHHRFSVQKVNKGIDSIDAKSWQSELELPKNNFFAYPSNLEEAELHRQCCYLQPDEEYVKKATVFECPCCNKKLNTKRENYLTYDVYKKFVKDYGVTLPLYFTFLKLHILILSIQFLTYGVFFMYISKEACLATPTLQCHDHDGGECNACEFVGFYSFIDFDNVRLYLSNQEHWKYQLFQVLSFFVFMINIMVPIIHDIITKYTRMRYWEYENIVHQKEHKLSLYIKHLPHKMKQEEIEQVILKAVGAGNSLNEIVYVYDIQPLKEMNEKRVQIFLDALIISRQLLELQNDGAITTLTLEQQKDKNLVLQQNMLELTFKAKIRELVYETTLVKQYQKNGLPFTNKVILKFQTTAQRNAVYLHYQTSTWQRIKTRVRVIKRSIEELKLNKQDKVMDIDRDVFESIGENGSGSICVDLLGVDVQQTVPYAKQTCGDDQLRNMQEDYRNDSVDTRELRVHRGFNTIDIYWDNLGVHTLTRLLLRVRSLFTTLVACSIMMVLFNLMYLYQNNPNYIEQKKNGGLSNIQKIIAYCFSILVTVVSTISTVVLLNETLKSKRSTYTDYERNVVTFMLFIQSILVSSFPFVISIEFWKGLSSVVPIYDLISLSQSRVFFKLLFHSLHVRQIQFWCRKRKVLKNFKPHLYFQGQLNLIMTPACFPQRGRTLATLFMYTTGVTMLYFSPIVVLLCIISDIYLYFFDKWSILRISQVDRKFTIKHLNFMIKTYQLIMLPMNIYLYLRLFWWSHWCRDVATPLMIALITFYIFFRRRFSSFVVMKVLRIKRHHSAYQPRSFFEAYNSYYQSLNIEDFTTLLTKVFKGTQKI